MSLIKAYARAGYHQLRYWSRLVTKEPSVITPLNSMTLDNDDVILAEDWLAKQDKWHDVEITEQYHTEFAAWNGSAHAFSFMGGRVALSSIIYALDLQAGDEVILPGYTCVVVPNAFSYAGIRIVYSDIELDTFGLDSSLLQAKISARTKAIMLHHLYGLVCRDYEKLIDIAHQNGLFVIEDCAHGLGAEYKGEKVGNQGDAAFFSTERSKVMNTIQGGIAVTNDDSLAARIREYACYASEPDEEWIQIQLQNVELAYVQAKHPLQWWHTNWNSPRYRRLALISTTEEEENGIRPSHYGRTMPAPFAALGLNQLSKVDSYNAQRRETAKHWDQWCEKNGYRKPLVISGSTPVYLRYPVLVEEEKKKDISWATQELGVELGVWFASNIHPVPWNVEDCPNADKAVKQCVNFPGLLN